MNQSPSNKDTQPPASGEDRRARHGLIEDWRDALGLLLLLFVAAALGAVLSRFWPESDVEGQPAMAELDTRLSALEGRLANLSQSKDAAQARDKMATLEARLADIEKRFAAVATQATAEASAGDPSPTAPQPITLLATAMRLDETRAKLVELEGRTAKLPSEVETAGKSIENLSAATTGLTTRLDDVAARLEKIESADILDLARRAALAAAIANFARATQGSQPFKAEFDMIARLLPDDVGLKTLEAHARTGLPTTGTLISGFGKTAADALDAERTSQQTEGMARLWTSFSGLVSWRSTSGQTGSATERRLAKAEALLRSGDLEAAIRELGAIKGQAATPLAPWLRDARARVAVEKMVARLNTQAIGAITPSPAPETKPPTEPPAR